MKGSGHGFGHGRDCDGEHEHDFRQRGFGPSGGGPRAFGPGGPGGGSGGRGFGRMRGGPGRMLEYGDLRFVLLSLISERPSHGYELIKVLEEKFGGIYSPSPGAIYPTLSLMDEQGIVLLQESQDGSTKKRYAITEQGQALLAENQVLVDGIFTRMQLAARAFAGERPPEVLMEAMHTLKHALMLHRGEWEQDEIKRVAAILNQAARDISSI